MIVPGTTKIDLALQNAKPALHVDVARDRAVCHLTQGFNPNISQMAPPGRQAKRGEPPGWSG
jgi:hypothetical protein